MTYAAGQFMAVLAPAALGWLRHGVARQGIQSDVARRVGARRARAGLLAAMRGMARTYRLSALDVAGRGVACRGTSWLGKPWLGKPWHGTTGRMVAAGFDSPPLTQGATCHGMAVRGLAWRGSAGLGEELRAIGNHSGSRPGRPRLASPGAAGLCWLGLSQARRATAPLVGAMRVAASRGYAGPGLDGHRMAGQAMTPAH